MLSIHRLAVAALVAAFCPSAAVAQGSTGPHVWDALTGLEPEAATPGWTARFHRFPLPGGMPCTQPTRSLGPGALSIDTLGCPSSVGYFEQAVFEAPLAAGQPRAFEAVLRVAQVFPGSDGAAFTVNVDGGCWWKVSVGADDVALSFTSLPEQRVAIGSTSSFRTYRLEVHPPGHTATLFVDGQQVLAGVGTHAPGGAACPLVIYPVVHFGDLSSQENGVTEWRSFVHDTAIRGYEFCDAEPDSSGTTARLYLAGSTSVGQNALAIGVGTPLLPPPLGVVLVSRTEGAGVIPAASSGRLCLGGSIGRFLGPGQLFPFQGSLGFLSVDLGALPQPNGSVAAMPGESWSFQLWYRDANPLPTSNFSTAVTALLE